MGFADNSKWASYLFIIYLLQFNGLIHSKIWKKSKRSHKDGQQKSHRPYTRQTRLLFKMSFSVLEIIFANSIGGLLSKINAVNSEIDDYKTMSKSTQEKHRPH